MESLEVCRTCLKLINLNTSSFFEIENEHLQLSADSCRYKILSVIPEMALNISKRSFLCQWCHHSLETIFEFKTKCLKTESMIMHYISTRSDANITELDLKDVASVYKMGFVSENLHSVQEKKFSISIDKIVGNCKDFDVNNGSLENKAELSVNLEELKQPFEKIMVKQEVLDDGQECCMDESITVVKHEVTNYSSETVEVVPPENTVLNLSKENGIICDVNIETPEDEINVSNDIQEGNDVDASFKCNICEKVFITKSRLKTHELCHSDTRPYKCTFCSKGFNDKSTLTKHLKIHSGVKEFECDMCQRQFYCRGNLNKHMVTHSGDRPFKCDVCDKDFSRNEHLKQHKLIHTGEKTFECDICSKKFARRDSLIIHMMVHTGVRNYVCEFCNKRCIDSSTLKKHLRSHTGDKPYECEICNHKFTQKTHLTIHLRKHTGERPFVCNICNKAFYSSNYLKIHIRTHTKEQPYECAVCKKKFSTLSNLSMHKKIHTGVRDFACGHCDKLFFHKHDLRKHIMVHTQERPFSCHICKKAFNKKIRAKQHIINMHKEVNINTVVIDRHCTTVIEAKDEETK